MPIYVRRADDDTWHWCTNCTDFPEPDQIAEEVALPSGDRPHAGELDEQCHFKERNENCSSSFAPPPSRVHP